MRVRAYVRTGGAVGPTLHVVLARAQVLGDRGQLLGVQVHTLRQQQQELAGVRRHGVPLHLLAVQEVAEQLGGPRGHVRRLLRGPLLDEAPVVLGGHKVHGLVLGHVAVDYKCGEDQQGYFGQFSGIQGEVNHT